MEIKRNMRSLISIFLVFALLTGCAGQKIPETEDPLQGENMVDTVEMPEFDVERGTFRYAGMFNEEKDAEAEYAYSDEYFYLDSSVYNPSLATMSLCLELSTWSSHDTENWSEKSNNAKALLSEIGFEDFEQNEFWNDKPSVKSVGAVAANKKLEDSTLIALAVRGGGYYNEWGSNVTVGLSGEHTGFAEGKQNVIHFLEEYIESHDITGRVKIWLVGYSRGGAIANMTAGYLNQNELPNGAELAFEDLYCYAFAPPKGAMESEIGEDSEHANIHNIINANDVVPLVAPGNWNFNRYNTTSRLLPTVTTVNFEEALAVMLEEYDEVLQGVMLEDPAAAEYGISEYAKKVEIIVDPLKFLPSGEPFVNVEIVDDTRQTMGEMLGNFIYSFAEHVHGRDVYYTTLETDMISLLDDLLGYEPDIDFSEAMDAFISALSEEHYKNLKYVLEPVFSLTETNKEERAEKVVDHLYEVVPQPEGYEDLYGTAASMLNIVGEIIEDDFETLMDMILAFADSKLMQAHYPEIMLAWMRSGDPHFTENPFTMKVPEAVRVIRINCPVDVEVFDSENNLSASIINDNCRTNNAVVGCAINGDGEKIIHLPSDEEYSVVITATDSGEVNITLSEYNMARSSVTRVQNYPEIQVSEGDKLTLSVPNIVEEEYLDAEQKGSSAEYCMTGTNEEEIPFEKESKGENIEFFNVTAACGNNFGLAVGGGSYLEGSFAKVEAKPISGSEFEGWYMDGEKVSDSPVYRFEVNGDTVLEARFSEIAMHELNFKVSGKGTVENIHKAYSEGSVVMISAVPAEGYVFDHWKSTSGTIADANSEQTTITVGNKAAVVTAVFRTVERVEICSGCGAKIEAGEKHKAPCGVENHYSCDGSEHSKELCEEGRNLEGSYDKEESENDEQEQKKRCSNCRSLLSANESHSASCGISGHYSCDGTDHSLCNSGGDVPEEVMICPNCGGEIAETDHSAPCGMPKHYTCDGIDHSLCNSGGDVPEEVMLCPNCGEEIAETDHSAPCGMPKHYTCDGIDHSSCNEETATEIVCKVCGVTYLAGEEHICAP